MKKILIILGSFLLLLITVPTPAQTRKADITLQLGAQTVTIPAPEGFEEAASQFENIRNRFTVTEDPKNDMLSVHLTHADCDKLRAGEAASFNFYTKVSVNRAVRELDYSAERFADLVSEFRRTSSQVLDIDSPELKETLKRLSQTLRETGNQETQVDMSQPQNLGEFDTRPNVYSIMLLVNVKTNSSAGQASSLIAGGLSFVRVKQRLIYVYTYHKYESTTDVETLRNFTKQWIGQILAAN